MPDKKTSQLENDVARLKARTNLVVGSFERAAGVNPQKLAEALRYFEHAFLYLEAAIK